jgi:hypothetical protein
MGTHVPHGLLAVEIASLGPAGDCAQGFMDHLALVSA